ncbi:MAG TPA: hypothetical protein VEA18_00990 [Candidatus Kapabacteria bacterium]|nr:hypothetical protein [Candidatus Kapabacteria bacterium]
MVSIPSFKDPSFFDYLHTATDDFWFEEEKKQTLALFSAAAAHVPAYKDFLQKNGVQPDRIRTWEDFQHVPAMNKVNYLRQYDLPDLSWDGTFVGKNLVFTSTSGSTGAPFYFPRTQDLDLQYATMVRLYLERGSTSGPILVIICFGMGVWIGGLITYKAFEIAGREMGCPISLITPGNNKEEIFNALQHIAPFFKQVIIIGYPPFVKDILDEAPSRNIDLSRIHVRLFFAAEAFTKQFRDYLVRTANIQNPYLDTMNIYGSADIGAMANETPLSILIRDGICNDKRLFTSLFGHISKTPTLAQYNPLFIHFETIDNKIHLTGNNAIPLIRYGIGDYGGVFRSSELYHILGEQGVSVAEQTEKTHIASTVTQLPFVYVYERADLSVKLYGAIIYPEHVRMALQDEELEHMVTGKFTMASRNDEAQNQFLDIHVELRKEIEHRPTLLEQIEKCIIQYLLRHNSEYANMTQMTPEKARPRVTLWVYESKPYFTPGIKQQWIAKENKEI